MPSPSSSDPEWDVIIVGGGGSGLAAAVAASRGGARTLVLEKGSQLGGSTRLAVGSITAPNTRLQRRHRITDDSEAFAEDSRKFTGKLESRDNLTLRRHMATNAAETVQFLEDLGVAFVGPYPEPPHRVPRMLNVVPGSRAYIAALDKEARALGATIRTGVQVQSLEISEGKVIGVKALGDQGMETIHGASVVLAAGDYSASPELKALHLREEARNVGAVNPLNTGDGHRLGAEAGGLLVNMDITDGPQLRFAPPKTATFLDRLPTHRVLSNVLAELANRMPPFILRRFAKQLLTAWMAPSPQFLRAGPVMVDIEGRRIDEGDDGLAYAVAGRPEQSAYLILNDQVAKATETAGVHISTAPGIAYAHWRDYQRGRKDLISSDSTISGLAQKLGMDPASLETSVRNSASAESFGAGKYYSIGPLRALFMTTEGGLKVDDECRVLDADGSRVPGLWAAGSNGQSGLILDGHGHHILWAITSGRMAGASAAAQRHAQTALGK